LKNYRKGEDKREKRCKPLVELRSFSLKLQLFIDITDRKWIYADYKMRVQ
jgi:hypothetical protein